MMMRTLAAFTTPGRTPWMNYDQYLEIRKVQLALCCLDISLLAFAAAMVVV